MICYMLQMIYLKYKINIIGLNAVFPEFIYV